MKKKLVFGILAVSAIILAACGLSNREVEERVAKTLTAVSGVQTSVPLTETLAPKPSATLPSLMETAVFTRAVDGDTIDVRYSDGREERVRLIGMDTPERGDPCFREATDAIELFEGQTVTLEKDVSERDRYGRLLRYVYVGEVMLNETQVATGWARVYTYPPDVKYADRFLAAQRIAQANGFGIWGNACKDNGNGGPIPLPTGVLDSGSTDAVCTGPDMDCGDFKTHAEAQAFFLACGGPSADPHKLDSDGDGLACESLP